MGQLGDCYPVPMGWEPDEDDVGDVCYVSAGRPAVTGADDDRARNVTSSGGALADENPIRARGHERLGWTRHR